MIDPPLTPHAVTIIAGTSASGKSRFALAYARQHNGVILNADSQQVYAGLPILTASPSDQDHRAVPHVLYGHIPPQTRYCVAQWLDEVHHALTVCWAKNQRPIIVGGTMLYLHALLHGMTDIPEIPPEVRAQSEYLVRTLDAQTFYAQVRERDPDAARLHATDTQRLRRLWEVVTHTSHPLRFWHQQPPRHLPLSQRAECVLDLHFLSLPRAEVYARANARVLMMMDSGAEQEVAALYAQKLDPDLPAMKILGVREIGAFLEGRLSRDEAISHTQQATRRYIKRQLTWFRHHAPWQNFKEHV